MSQATCCYRLQEINVGIIPIGTGNDWVKTYNIPRNIRRCHSVLLKAVKLFSNPRCG